ncbi:MAG: NAD(P)-binding domain-containing protein [Myxococcota bacterium]|nr:NAD(P)-binding domain-containing protein [Myxococcota bacterium]
MTTLYYERDADPESLQDESISLVGYGNQGRSWALNLRDSGYPVQICARADESRDRAAEEGFATAEIEAASDSSIVCILVPDDAIASLPLSRKPGDLTVVASGYTLAFDRFSPQGDVGMIAPRMLGPEVRLCYLEGEGFITAFGIHQDQTGRALARTLAIAHAMGGLKQGALALDPTQEATLDLAVEQLLSPALSHVNSVFVRTLLAQGIPMEAIMTELYLSGEVERNYRLLKEVGFVGQLGLHSPASQYGQLSRRGAFDELDFGPIMEKLLEDITSGRFADEWDEQGRQGYPGLEALKKVHAGPGIQAFEDGIRERLGPAVAKKRD